jgi:hypothetical protein
MVVGGFIDNFWSFQAVADRLHKVCLVGCAAKGLSTHPGDPTAPGISEDTPALSEDEDRPGLEPNHSHFALLRAHHDQVKYSV